MRRRRVFLSALVPLAVLTVLATTVIAHAGGSGADIKLASQATLVNPSNVIVDVTYTCLPSQFLSARVSIVQSQTIGGASGSRIDVYGFGYFVPTCDDRWHKQSVLATTFYGGGFVPGIAGASAFVFSGVVFANTSAELSIR